MLESIAAAVIGGVSLQGGVGGVVPVILGALFVTMLSNAMDLLGSAAMSSRSCLASSSSPRSFSIAFAQREPRYDDGKGSRVSRPSFASGVLASTLRRVAIYAEPRISLHARRG